MVLFNDNEIRKALVTVSVEQVLHDIGTPTYEKVIHQLYQEYHCYLPDCFEHPEYLNKILKQLFGNSYLTIVDSIKNRLKDFSSQKSINDFLVSISK